MRLAEMLTDPQLVDAWRLDESTLAQAVPQLSTAILQLEALRVRLVREADQRCIPEHLGAADSASWLAGATRMTGARAGTIVRLGRELPLHPKMTAALDAGQIELGHVQVIVNFLDRLATLTAEDAAEGAETDWDNPDPESGRPDDCQAYLLIAAQLEDSKSLRKRARALELLLQLDGTVPPDGENPELNEFYASISTGGRVHVKGTFDAEAGEALETALSGLSKPRPSTDDDGNPIRDPRSAAKRRADALEQIVRGHLDRGQGPLEGGQRPHVSITIDYDALVTAVRAKAEAPATGPWTHGGWLFNTDTASRPAGNGDDDTRHCRHRKPARMPWLGPISSIIGARVSCDAEITAILTSRHGNPLDVGTTTRTISPQLRKALVARDCGCAFPGCGRPAAWTEAHHIRHWADGGPTALSNLVLLCRKHHTQIHENHWAVQIGDDGHPTFTPPAWVDPRRRPRPAHNRRLLHPAS
ncbi:DUF222 domain-containing protein [Rhodococcus sp. NPDC059234]|uniref:HNH endonuclease signature motif containing protein n=1 Tax=Rhodococcus sp. NPDC059234 TaxID=3346781 RepID=UPI00366F3215